MSMLKCGQKNNLNYTYGMKIEDIDSENENINTKSRNNSGFFYWFFLEEAKK